MKYSKYSAVIIGSGLSGLFLANKLSENNKLSDGILIVTKSDLNSGSTPLAQGGIVSVIPEINKSDSIESHIKDTIKAGCGLNNINTIRYVSENSASAAQELIRYGVEFDKNEKNNLNFTLEGAHSCPRILHAKGDSTGRIIEEALCKKVENNSNIEIYSNSIAVELLLDSSDECKGLVIFDKTESKFEVVYTSNVIIATGGIGQIYKNTTNPEVSTADGIALAHRAGAILENMEFVQFHPTALYCKNKKSMPLVSESARGEGAKLVDKNGNYFAKNYHELADLAPRDVVARAIKNQMDLSNEQYVNLDISQIGIEKFKQRFPTITSLCEDNNIDLSNGLIPVVPAEHYFMGGIKTDIQAKTSIKNIYALGECASTGLHGANRLASNSLLECVVFAQSLSKFLEDNLINPPKKHDYKIQETIEKYLNVEVNDDNLEIIANLFDKLKQTMSDNVAIIRSEKTLMKALDNIHLIERELKALGFDFNASKFELENSLCVAKIIIKSALKRKESIGAHFREDSVASKQNNLEGNIYNDKILAK